MVLLALTLAVVVTLFVYGVKNLNAGKVTPGVLMVVAAAMSVTFVVSNITWS